MAISRPFAYNPTLQTSGVSAQYGTFSVGFPDISYGTNPGGLKWWDGPDESLGYVIGTSLPTGGRVAPDGTIGNVQFWRTTAFTDSSYITLSNKITGQSFTSTQDASNYFFFNGYWTAYPLTVLFVGGNFTAYSGISNNRIVRLNTDGSYDTSFVIGNGFNVVVRESLIQSDGKIIVGGDFTTYSGISSNNIARLNTNGSYDTSYIVGTGFNGAIVTSSIQSDQKIIFGGQFTTYQGTTRNRIARLNTNGSYDTSFVIGTGFDGVVNTSPIQSDGKIVLGGQFTTYQGTTRNGIARLNTDGSYDTSFIIGTGFNGAIFSSLIQSDGKIIVSGAFSTYSGISSNNIVRLNTNGSYDTSFVVGTGFQSNVNTLALQSDGKIIAGGDFISYSGISRNRIVRLNTDGSYDTSFVIGTGFNGTVSTSSIQSDGKIIVGGTFTSYSGISNNRIARLNTNGSYDSTFNSGTNNLVNSFSIQPDGKTIVGGDFTSYQSNVNRVISLYENGNIRQSFNIGIGFNDIVRTSLIQSDGKIIVGGDFTSYQGTSMNKIVRLNTDGSLDTSFVIGTGFDINSSVDDSIIQSDGKIILCGSFSAYSGVTRRGIVRLNTNGSYDTSFIIGTGFAGSVNTSSIQSDGKIIVGGSFISYSGISSNRIARINTDGSYDTSFVIGTGFDDGILTSSIQSDGKIIVGGFFSSYSGISSNRIARLNTDGSYDSSFVIGTGFIGIVRSSSIQSDGKIIIGGDFTTYQGVTRNRIARLNTDGSYDTSFVIGDGFNNTVSTSSVQSDGKILIGGGFTTYSGISTNKIVRLNTNGSYDTSFTSGNVTNLQQSVVTILIKYFI